MQVLHAFDDDDEYQNSAATQELAAETAILAQLRHPNIIKFLGLARRANTDTGAFHAMIITEWCNGNIAYWLQEGYHFAAELLETAMGITAGME